MYIWGFLSPSCFFSLFYSPINDLQSYLKKSFLGSTIPFTPSWWHLSLWSSLVWLLLSATSEPVDESFSRGVEKELCFSHCCCLWWQHLSKHHCLEQSWKSLSTSPQALISFSCLQFCALFLLRCWPHTSSLLMPSLLSVHAQLFAETLPFSPSHFTGKLLKSVGEAAHCWWMMRFVVGRVKVYWWTCF